MRKNCFKYIYIGLVVLLAVFSMSGCAFSGHVDVENKTAGVIYASSSSAVPNSVTEIEPENHFSFEFSGDSDVIKNGLSNFDLSGEYKLPESRSVEVSSFSTEVVIVSSDAGQIVFSNQAALSVDHILAIRSTDINNDYTDEEIRNMDLLNGQDVMAPGNQRSWTFAPGFYFLFVYRSDGMVYYTDPEVEVALEDDLECMIFNSSWSVRGQERSVSASTSGPLFDLKRIR